MRLPSNGLPPILALSCSLSLALVLAPGCSSADDGAPPGGGAADAGPDAALDESPADAPATDAPSDASAEPPAPCPADMVDLGGFCIDRYEAPNREGALPLVMYTFVEAAAWCQARDKRLCFDDEWTTACEGPALTSYPYGDAHQPGVCNDDQAWRVYNQTKLNGWPWNLPASTFDKLADLLDAARQTSNAGAVAADEVQALYQGSPSGAHGACTNSDGAFDLCGNVEEWTRRRDGGSPDFHGSLKGRYWAEARTCQSAVTTHGDAFRFYEIGFRCCRDPLPLAEP